MSDFETKEAEIYSILKDLVVDGIDDEIFVSQDRPEVMEKLPAVTFYILDNFPIIDLSREVKTQKVQLVVDLWGDTSIVTGKLLTEVESRLRQRDYLLVSSRRVPDPEGVVLNHVVATFNF